MAKVRKYKIKITVTRNKQVQDPRQRLLWFWFNSVQDEDKGRKLNTLAQDKERLRLFKHKGSEPQVNTTGDQGRQADM